MRKIVAFAVILSFIATASLGLAATKMSPQEGVWVLGKVVAIENGTLSLRETHGQIFKVSATNDKLQGIHIGDRVAVKDVNGRAISVKEMGKENSENLFTF